MKILNKIRRLFGLRNKKKIIISKTPYSWVDIVNSAQDIEVEFIPLPQEIRDLWASRFNEFIKREQELKKQEINRVDNLINNALSKTEEQE